MIQWNLLTIFGRAATERGLLFGLLRLNGACDSGINMLCTRTRVMPTRERRIARWLEQEERSCYRAAPRKYSDS